MVNSEIGRGLYKAYRTDGQRVALQWLYSGSTVALQWLYSGSTVGLQRTKDEQRTKNGRREGGFKRKLLTTYSLKEL